MDMHRTHNKEVTLRKKEEIENFKEKCDLLEKSGWVAKFHIDNWAKKGHQDSNGYWVSYPEYSIDEAYEKVKSSYTLSLKEKDVVIRLLEKELYSGDYDILDKAFESERNLLKKLKTT
jgi:hypothetical protein